MTTLKVHVVEGSPTMRQLIVFALKRIRNFQIVEANDGVDGLKKLNSEKFDLILTDINMPDINGLELINFVKSNPTYREIPLIIITTERGEEDRKRGMALGAFDYVTKPFKGDALKDLVKKVLGL